MAGVEMGQAVSVYLASHCEMFRVIKRIRKNMMYGRNFETIPVTMKNRIVFVMILFLVFFFINAPFD